MGMEMSIAMAMVMVALVEEVVSVMEYLVLLVVK